MGAYEIGLIIIGIMLCVQSYWDVRFQKIPIGVSLAGAIAGVCLVIISQRPLADVGVALLPGVICLLAGKVTREAIGYGDGICLCVMGFFYSIERLAFICITAFGAAGIAALLLLIILKKNGKESIPFVPFLGIGWMCDFIIQIGSAI